MLTVNCTVCHLQEALFFVGKIAFNANSVNRTSSVSLQHCAEQSTKYSVSVTSDGSRTYVYCVVKQCMYNILHTATGLILPFAHVSVQLQIYVFCIYYFEYLMTVQVNSYIKNIIVLIIYNFTLKLPMEIFLIAITF